MAKKTNLFKIIKEYPLREGRFPLKVSLVVWNDGKSKPYIDLYSGYPSPTGQYKNNHFKISDKSSWARIKKIIDEDLVNRMSKSSKPLPEKTIEKQVLEDIKRLKEDKVRLAKTIQEYSKLIKEQREVEIPTYEEDIKLFEKLLSSAKTEGQLQKFLSKRPWLLGLEYENSQPQKIAPAQRYDFYLEKYDGFADIIEIKKVSEKIFDEKGKITKPFSDSIQQLINYIDDALYYGDSKRLSQQMKFNFLKPKGILIIGRTDNKERLRNLQYYFHNIDILSYQDVLDRAKNIVKGLKAATKSKRKKSKKKTNTKSPSGEAALIKYSANELNALQNNS